MEQARQGELFRQPEAGPLLLQLQVLQLPRPFFSSPQQVS
jgi:hypothetical protein